jgi:hypothetical protein
MSTGPEGSGSGEFSGQDVFEVFDRASSPRPNTATPYFIGDGIVVRVGWVDNSKETPDLTLELRDEKLGNMVGFIVNPESARYTRQAAPLAWDEWLRADPETRRQARQFNRSEAFSVPTAVLAPVAQGVARHDPETEPEPSTSETLYQSALAVEPSPATDISFIRSLIEAWSKGL